CDENTMELQQLSKLRAYKRSPVLSNSTWYKGVLVSEMAGSADNDGAFNLAINKMRRGSEPPNPCPQARTQFFYLLSVEMSFFVGGQSLHSDSRGMHVTSLPRLPWISCYV